MMMVMTITTISKQGNSWVQTKVEDLASQFGGKHEERGRFGPFRQNTLSLQRYIAGKRAKQTQLPPSFENKETLPQARIFKFHLQPNVEVTTTILSTYVFSVLLWLAPRILFSVFSNFQDEHFLRPPWWHLCLFYFSLFSLLIRSFHDLAVVDCIPKYLSIWSPNGNLVDQLTTSLTMLSKAGKCCRFA